MKLLAATFGIYILFLAIFPTIVNLNLENKKEHCQKMHCPFFKSCKKNSDNKKDNGCTKGSCTPFFGCSKIQVVIPTTVEPPNKPIISCNNYSLYAEGYLSVSLNSIWHPPKAA